MDIDKAFLKMLKKFLEAYFMELSSKLGRQSIFMREKFSLVCLKVQRKYNIMLPA